MQEQRATDVRDAQIIGMAGNTGTVDDSIAGISDRCKAGDAWTDPALMFQEQISADVHWQPEKGTFILRFKPCLASPF